MASQITVTVIGLAAQVAICRTLVTRTNPGINSTDLYGVALNEQHYRDLFMRATTPPVTAHPSTAPTGDEREEDIAGKSSLLMMGFPSRIVEASKSLCACHSRPTRGGYLCSRCSSKVCALPSTCPACGLTLILSTHLARSYHHLFPLRNWAEVSWARASKHSDQPACFGCQTPFPTIPSRETQLARRNKSSANQGASTKGREGGVSESGRYECATCARFFCIDCDVFAHEIVHNCPGCQSREGALLEAAARVEGAGDHVMKDAGLEERELEREQRERDRLRREKGKGKEMPSER